MEKMGLNYIFSSFYAINICQPVEISLKSTKLIFKASKHFNKGLRKIGIRCLTRFSSNRKTFLQIVILLILVIGQRWECRAVGKAEEE